MIWLNVDDTIRETHGYAEQAAAFGHDKVKALNAMLAAVSTAVAIQNPDRVGTITGLDQPAGQRHDSQGAIDLVARHAPRSNSDRENDASATRTGSVNG